MGGEAVDDLWRGIGQAERRRIELSPLPHLEWMRARVGEREVPGDGSNPLILAAARAIGLDWYRRDETPWCAVFLYGALAAVGLPTRASALARSFCDHGTALAWPVRGAIGVIPRGSNPLYGHVFVIDRVEGRSLRVIEANASDMVKVGTVARSSLLPNGIRWPAGLAMTEEAKAAAAAARPDVRGFGARWLDMHDEGEDVRALQRALTRLGVKPRLDGTGWFGPKTRAAVEAFQARKGLAVDGIVGDLTFGALTAALDDLERRAERAKAARPAAAAGGVGGAAIGAAGGALAAAGEFAGELEAAAGAVGRLVGDLDEVGALALATVGGGLLAWLAMRWWRARGEAAAARGARGAAP